ncbi:MAG: DUF2971 domain-containing protein [Pseudomonadales bacterium]
MQNLPSDERRNRRFLYKYLPVDSESTNSNIERKKLFDLLVTGELYLSSSNQFNDPNEFRANLSFTKDKPTLRKWAEGAFLKYGWPAENLTDDDKNSLIEGLCRQAPLRSDALQDAYDRSVASFGVYCFSRNPRSHLMWAHYARSHRGICVQIDPAYCLEVFAGTQTVEYSSQLPKVTWPSTANELSRGFLRKSEEWSYEKELRYLSHHLTRSGLPFDARAVTGVILGERFFDESNATNWLREALSEREALGLSSPKLYQVTRNSAAYSLSLRLLPKDAIATSLTDRRA